jgi:hypothetical protein
MTALRVFGVLTVGLIILAILVMPVGRSQQQTPVTKKPQKAFDESRFPLADFSSPEPTDETERSKQRARAQKYDRSKWHVNPNDPSDSTVRVDFVDPNLPAFPAAKADAIVIGRITKAQANLSNDKSGIYTTFTIAVDEVVKNSSRATFATDGLIEAEREGGRVKFPSGRIHLYMVSEQNMPRVGSRYVLFLSGSDGEPVFQLLTGYELSEGRVYPLDELAQTKAYENAAETSFLNELKSKVSNP